MLKSPTMAPPDLAYLFDYQLSVLNIIWLEDEQLEAKNNEVLFFTTPSLLVSHPRPLVQRRRARMGSVI